MSTIVWHDKTAKYYGSSTWGPVPVKLWGISSVGLIAVDLATGDAKMLLLDSQPDVRYALARGCGFHWIDDESCYVWLDESGEPASKENRNWGLQAPVYRWNVRTNELTKLGGNWLIADFAAAAGPSVASRIVWPPSDRPWDGWVELRGQGASKSHRFKLVDIERVREDPLRTRYFYRRPRFAPGPHDGEVTIADFYVGKPDETCLRVVAFVDEPKMRWSLRPDDFDFDEELQLSRIRIPQGISRGYRYLPIVATTASNGLADKEFLFSFDASDGSGQRLRQLPYSHRNTGISTSADGTRVAWARYERERLREIKRFVTVFDVAKAKLLAHRSYEFDTSNESMGVARPLGFNGAGMLLLGHTESIQQLAPDYQGDLQQVFRLQRSQ